MPRPRKCRKVCCLPENSGFLPLKQNENPHATAIIITVDEYETLRLIDRESFSQEQCGEYMHIARATVQQIYTSARKKIADALVEGRAIQIAGGDYRLCDGLEHTCDCGGCRKHRGCDQTGTIQSTSTTSTATISTTTPTTSNPTATSITVEPTPIIGGKPMKIAIPLDENQTDVCPVLARAPFFLFWADGAQRIVPNPAAAAQGGAGVQVAQFLVDEAITVLITPRCGQNAADIFAAAALEIFKSASTAAAENLAAYQNGTLEVLTQFHGGYHGIQ